MHRHLPYQGAALAAWAPAQGEAQSGAAAAAPPAARLLVFDGLTLMLGERLTQALKVTATSPVAVEVVDRTASLEAIQARFRVRGRPVHPAGWLDRPCRLAHPKSEPMAEQLLDELPDAQSLHDAIQRLVKAGR